MDIIPYQEIEVTADLGIVAQGRTLEELMTNAAKGMLSLMIDLDRVAPLTRTRIQVSGDTFEDILFAALNEILFLMETRNMVYSDFNFELSSDNNSLWGQCLGEKLDPKRHTLSAHIKAATYHELNIIRNQDGIYQVKIIFDI